MLTFRLMEKSEIELVHKIEQGANAIPWAEKEIQSSLDSAHKIWLCCLQDQTKTPIIIAYAVVTSVLDESSLLNLCVSIDHQGKGYGKALLKHLLEQAEMAGQEKFFLEVRASNLTALGLYESCGFVKVGERKSYYRSGKNEREDALIYSWTGP